MRNEPITSAQTAYLSKLINHVKKPAYQAAKRRLGLDTTIMQLSKSDASRLIRELVLVKNGRSRVAK